MLKQKFSKVTALFLIAAMVVTCLTALPAGAATLPGDYPTHPTENDKAYYTMEDTGVSVSSSIAEALRRTFTVPVEGDSNTYKYVLLDTDEDGNFFVIEDYHWQASGKRDFYTGTFSVNTSGTDAWRFDHSNTNSIAYWMDNTYREQPLWLPTVVKNNQILYNWPVEANYPYVKAGDGSASAALKTNSQPYTTTGYMAFMSATEFDTYKGIMGLGDLAAGDVYSSIMLRTTFTQDNNGTLSGRFASYYYSSANGNIITGSGAPNYSAHYHPRRACFWLDKDFFSNVMIDWTESADIVEEVVKEQGYDNLLNAGYSQTFLNELFDIKAPWYGLYPEHPETNDKAYWIDNAAQLSPNVTIKTAVEGSTPRLFMVDDEEFILLDKDTETGNYFVSATRAITSSAGYNYINHDLRKAYYATAPEASTGVNEWRFDYENEDSIAYYLDNTYLNDARYIPSEMKDEIVTFDWQVEGDYPRLSGSDTALRAEKAAEKIANNPPYTATGKVALMSATEFKTYAHLLGAIDMSPNEAEGWTGASLRTPRTNISSKTENGQEIVTVSPNPAGFIWRLPNNTTYNEANKLEKGYWAGNGGYANAPNVAKIPCFWVSGDFFKNVKLELNGETTTGEIVVDELKALGYSELSEIYSDEELEYLGYEPDKMPVAENPVIIMAPHETALIRCNYDYISPIDAEESGSEIIWYVSDTEDGEYTEFARSDKAELVVPDGYAGKYIKATVTAGDEDGRLGKTARDCVPVKVLLETNVFVGEVEFSSGSADIAINNLTGETQTLKILVSVYDSNGRLTELNPTEFEISGTSVIKTVSLSGGESYMIMLWTEDNRPIFYTERK